MKIWFRKEDELGGMPTACPYPVYENLSTERYSLTGIRRCITPII